ncbi:hypothetical protein [Rhodococcoides yunnanense]|uniref:hypothetical protein n=1 Tax=Rhodococcoides yunnanense TaxID=278209 RepID=UPI0009348E17|nr:hypothetical protein [Rhodococcus yunnanensis]
MRTAVVRVVIDAEGELDVQAYDDGIRCLREQGLEIVASPGERLPPRGREIELIVSDTDLAERAQGYALLCETAFGRPAYLGVITYISRGTDDDVVGVLAGFGIDGQVERTVGGRYDLVTVTVRAEDMRRVPESRLHTALEAALNCEVEIVVA